jgi:hypothetical protein
MNAPIAPAEAIREIVDWAKTHYTDDLGGLARTINEDGRPSKERLFNDLGDYLPFFAFLGEDDFCLKQLEDTRCALTADGLLAPDFRYLGFPCVRSYEHTDLLLGLIDAYTFLPSETLQADILRVAHGVKRAFHPEDGYPSSWHFPSLRLRFPVLDLKDGMFIEIWTLLYRHYNNPSFLRTAEQLADHILSLAKQRSTPLVPDVIGTTLFGRWFVNFYFKKGARRYTPIKYIANTVYGFLELYKETNQQTYRQFLEQARTVIAHDLCDAEGAIHIGLQSATGVQHLSPAKLVQNFPMIDWAADCAYFLKDDSFLRLAERIARPWLEAQDRQTGLIPQDLGGTTTDLDNLTDTSIAFLKLAELTDDARYRTAAHRIIDGILTYHRQPERYGYALSVDTRTGEVVDGQRKIKFICLFLKTLIVRDRGTPIFGTELYDLTKDR